MIVRIIMWIVMLVGGGALGLWLDWRWFRPLLLSPLFHLITLILGALLLRMVLRASRNTGRALAKLGREGDIPRMETNKLVTEGVYACMRHPMHLGLLFFPLAIALIIGSPTFIFLIAPLEMLFMIILIKLVEEREALQKFGDAYEAYRQRTPMFSLRISCLRQLLAPKAPTQD
jgi:protein-S-isoprenylcysteine O-methyltransferase Ste14